MGRHARLALVITPGLALAACSAFEATEPAAETTDASTDGSQQDGAGTTEAGEDASVVDSGAPCTADMAFQTPVLVAEIAREADSGIRDEGATLTPDERLLVFGSTRIGDTWRLFYTTRANTTDPFGAVAPLSGSASYAAHPSLSPDGLRIFFATQATQTDPWDLVTAVRGQVDAAFGNPNSLDNLNTVENDWTPFVAADGKTLYFSRLEGDYNVLSSVYANGMFEDAIPVGGVNSGSTETWPVLSADERTIYFASDRPNTSASGGMDIYVATRASKGVAFENARPVVELNSADIDTPAWLSVDGCRLYMSSGRGGLWRIYRASKR